jgi:23S rRNA pseudouridine1911/1915/1917 synthase
MPEESYPTELRPSAEDAGSRLDQYLVANLPDVSRVRVQQMLEAQKILVNGKSAKSSLKLRGDEQIAILGKVQPAPLKAFAEELALDIVYEDDDLAVVNKPAGMLVHAGSGNGEDPRNRGTLVNALLHHFGTLSGVNGELRPGIVHRLDKETSGLVIIAKNDIAHRKLSEQFSGREVNKRYIALVHGWPKADTGTVNAAVSRDQSQRTRMTTKGHSGRDAISHYTVLERFASPYGKFSLIEVKIETGRTHQIRVHMSSIGHPVVGDTLYGAPAALSSATRDREIRGTSISTRNEAKKLAARKLPSATSKTLSLTRNFLHAAAIEFKHPTTKKPLSFSRPIPQDLADFLVRLKEDSTAGPAVATGTGPAKARK